MKGEINMMRKIESNNQKQLAFVVNNKIHELEAALDKANAQFNDWDNVDEKTKRVYKTPEEFKTRVIDRLADDKAHYIRRLDDIKEGYVME